jgi:hypothetical protein
MNRCQLNRGQHGSGRLADRPGRLGNQDFADQDFVDQDFANQDFANQDFANRDLPTRT